MATVIKLNGKDYTLEYGYGVTVRTNLVEKVIALTDMFTDETKVNDPKSISYMISSLGELVLVGLQKKHRDEFGFNYETDEGKAEKLDLVYDMLDDYFDDGGEFVELFETVQNELLNNGFLAKMLQGDSTKPVTKTKSKK